MNEPVVNGRKSARKVLVALDGSRASLDVVSYLSYMLAPKDSEVVLFNVSPSKPESFWDIEQDPGYAPLAIWSERRTRALNKFMDQSRDVFLKAGFGEDHVSMRIKDRTVGIARDIIREAKKGYDAVVFGRVGSNPITRLVIGSVAEKLLSSLEDVPVWLVAKTMKNRKVLIAMDSSACSMRCVEYAGRMLADTDAEFMLFHVLRNYDFRLMEDQDDIVTELESSRWFKITDEELAKARLGMQEAMTEAKTLLEHVGVAPERVGAKIMSGMATRGGTIAAQALLGGYGTVVIGRRGLSEAREFNMGRVCRKVVHLAGDTAVWVVS